MFSVYAGNARSSWLVVGAVASCSTHAGLQHWNFGHRNCCASVERSMLVTSWMSSARHVGVWPAIDWCTRQETL